MGQLMERHRRSKDGQNILCKRSEDKLSFLDTWVRDREALVVYLFTLVKQDVKVNVPRTFIDDLRPSHVILGTLQHVK